jgi:hypothetical protein
VNLSRIQTAVRKNGAVFVPGLKADENRARRIRKLGMSVFQQDTEGSIVCRKNTLVVPLPLSRGDVFDRQQLRRMGIRTYSPVLECVGRVVGGTGSVLRVFSRPGVSVS